MLSVGANPNIGDDFVNINATAKRLRLNPLQVLYEREDRFSDKLNSRATFKGFTALHYAVLADDLNMIKLLLENGADPLIENDLGHRPIEYCNNTADDETKKLLQTYESKVKKSQLKTILN